MRHKRAATVIFVAITVSLAVFAGCGGGGSGTAPPVMQPNNPPQGSSQPSNPPQGSSQTVSIPLTSANSVALPSVSGITSTIAISGNNASGGATLTVGVSTGSPKGMVTIPAASPTAFEYFSLTPSADVTFTTFPKMTLTMPSAPHSQGNFYAWLYSVSGATWTSLGAVTVSGTTLSFGGSNSNISLKSGATYVVAVFTSGIGAACPTPTPLPNCAPVATPTPGPTPSGTKLYVTNGCANNPHPSFSAVTVYDENGDQLFVKGGFPNVSLPLGIAFDSANQELYITNPGNNTITVYDLSGDQLSTSGKFPGLSGPAGIAFDPFNQHLYVANGGSISVYDQNGNAVSTTGHFSGFITFPAAIAFDSLNRHLYITDLEVGNAGPPVRVYDEDGNQIMVSGSFPPMSSFGGNFTGITFNPVNRHLYLSNGTIVTSVFDENGNNVAVFEGGSVAAAFNASNQLLYFLNLNSLQVRRASGNLVPVSGTFPNLIFSQGIVAAPQ